MAPSKRTRKSARAAATSRSQRHYGRSATPARSCGCYGQQRYYQNGSPELEEFRGVALVDPRSGELEGVIESSSSTKRVDLFGDEMSPASPQKLVSGEIFDLSDGRPTLFAFFVTPRGTVVLTGVLLAVTASLFVLSLYMRHRNATKDASDYSSFGVVQTVLLAFAVLSTLGFGASLWWYIRSS